MIALKVLFWFIIAVLITTAIHLILTAVYWSIHYYYDGCTMPECVHDEPPTETPNPEEELDKNNEETPLGAPVAYGQKQEDQTPQ